MTLPEERPAGEQIALFRSAGYAAFGRHERDLDVLDLIFDSIIDNPGVDDVRRLRFAGHGVTLDVTRTALDVELWVFPAGPVVIESRGDELSGLVSFLLRWPGGAQRPVRTAWVML
ncbi:hypothetical protein EV651_101703 [Kribbella sp. VKM Ac-2571]|uniref:hypothetical protein n=1 Tax=Kribbella sp. VKM Ac-2571 TaxID=2512222 RepID=UPI0010606022|nr:hypothetical protein [Kribbella sp. VKM Ac-2571]TDO69658.1 hypothetical protein EV651_101703 [Kribbella sp. VKM Ac-2571]